MKHYQQRGFTFKQFHVAHEGCAMKVGTDGILLGGWTRLQQPERILDIGCGSGLIALMLAQRTQHMPIAIDAIDIDADAVTQSRQNVTHSPWAERIHIYHQDLVDFNQGHYSHLVSNPPYFPHGQVFEDPRRAIARQTYTLSHQQLLIQAARLARSDATLSLILPYAEGEQLLMISQSSGWYLRRRCEVVTKIKSIQPQRLLLEFSRCSGDCESQQLSIYQQPGVYSQTFKRLYRDFYLNLD
ncbi:tRNA1(Val) (adenine(37)-N6)-methyltransferase [Celerinatantimonas sp. YJH-8]|uniref:tRNA1(Val) (adenine(37)-N6)-methyltransferase n=1 Tax=Celerinatantimonas sp. YJH-8 TaxID=3228714 RepID=UPI0038C7673A